MLARRRQPYSLSILALPSSPESAILGLAEPQRRIHLPKGAQGRDAGLGALELGHSLDDVYIHILVLLSVCL